MDRTPNRRPAHALFCLLISGLTGCATMVHGTSQVIPILSTPSGARVSVDSVPVGTTPLLATLSRGQSHVVTISRDNLADVKLQLKRQVSGWVAGNMFLYYLPALVDFTDGAAFKFTPDTIRAVFPESVADGDSPAVGFTGLERIRFLRSGSDQSFVYARVDSSTAEQLYVHWSADTVHRRFDIPSVVPLADVRRLDVDMGADGRQAGAAAAHYTGIVTWGLPVAVSALAGVPWLGLVVGGYYTVVSAPAGYGIGALAAGSRWSPYQAHRIGSPLLVNDRLRIRLAGAERSISARLVTLDSSELVVASGQDTTRLRRSAIASIRRHDGYDFARGAKRALLVGSIVGAFTGSQVGGSIVKPSGPGLMIGAGLGAVVGLLGTSALAPRRWAEVFKW